MTLRALDQRGITLTELMIVGVIGVLVLLAMGGFYLQSQTTWLDASSQSITQREATMVAEVIGDSVRSSNRAIVAFTPDNAHCQLALYKLGSVTPSYYFWWNPVDSLIHSGTNTSAGDRGPMLQSKVERFSVSSDVKLVSVDLLARAATGQRIGLSVSAVMRNRTP